MERPNGLLRESWSNIWPGIALGVFSGVSLFLLVGIAVLTGRYLTHAHLIFLFPLYPVIPGLALLAIACMGPLLSARTRGPFMLRLAGRFMPFIISFAAFAFGFYSTLCLLPLFSAYLDEFFPYLGASLILLLLYSAANAAIRRMPTDGRSTPAVTGCLILSCLGSLGMLGFLCTLLFPS